MGRLALNVDTWFDRGRAVIEVAGEVDVYSVPLLREVLAQLAPPRPVRLAVVMSAVEFIDSSGIGVLVGAVKRAEPTGGRVALVGCTPHIASMLRTMGLHRVFGMHTELESAFAWLDSPR